MKIHSDTLRECDLYDALARAKAAGHVDRAIYLETLPAGSRQRRAAWEAQMYYVGAKVPGDGRRPRNTGKHGASCGWGPNLAAFYDEWGWWMVELFRLDAAAIVGPYNGVGGFHEMTRYRFASEPLPTCQGFGPEVRSAQRNAERAARKAEERELLDWWAGQRERAISRSA